MPHRPTLLTAALSALLLLGACSSSPPETPDSPDSVPITPDTDAPSVARDTDASVDDGEETPSIAEEGSPSNPTSEQPTAPYAPPSEPQEATPAPPQQLADARGEIFCAGSHEGCHTKDDMQIYTDHMIGFVSPMFDEIYGAQYRPVNFWFVPSGSSGKDCGGYSDQSYHYCIGEQSIYIGQEKQWFFYSGLGDAAPAVGLAHEWAHHIQNIMGVPKPATPAESVHLENQADCIAGTWVYHADANGYLEYPDDVADIEGILKAIAAAEENVRRTHGTLQERTDSLVYGYTYGLRGCNGYYPETPIYRE